MLSPIHETSTCSSSYLTEDQDLSIFVYASRRLVYKYAMTEAIGFDHRSLFIVPWTLCSNKRHGDGHGPLRRGYEIDIHVALVLLLSPSLSATQPVERFLVSGAMASLDDLDVQTYQDLLRMWTTLDDMESSGSPSRKLNSSRSQ